jgi:hypothetical protein
VQKEHGPLPLDQAPDVVHGAIKAATDSRSPQSMRANLYATLLNLMRASPHDVRTAVTGTSKRLPVGRRQHGEFGPGVKEIAS